MKRIASTPRTPLSAALVALVLAALVSACGQRGPLYLPETSPPAQAPASGTAPPSGEAATDDESADENEDAGARDETPA